MLNLAIEVDVDQHGNSVIQTNTGDILMAPGWPRDCEFQIVSYRKQKRIARVVHYDTLSKDIDRALEMIKRARLIGRSKPKWFVRLQEAAVA